MSSLRHLLGSRPQHLFFVDDGRTTNLLEAIMDDFILGNFRCQPSSANAVVFKFVTSSASDRQSILHFLRSL